ncbi:MAG: hypothetical protein E6I19_13855, partial [Chloroflexi bacterium]
MRRRRLSSIVCAVLLLAASLAGPAWPARADATPQDKIDPALRVRMAADPLAVLPVIVEMQQPAAPFGAMPNVDRANAALDLLRQYGTPVAGLSLIDSAAGFANADGINALSLVPAVAYIHHDATVRPLADSMVTPGTVSEIPPLPTPIPTLPPIPTPTPTNVPTPTPTSTPT